MAFTTPNMSLKSWTQSADDYDHAQLSDNFLKLDQHDHSPGKGVQIDNAGIADQSITDAKIYPGALSSAALADSSITERKLDPNILPIGTVTSWWRPTTATPLPSLWVLCDGSVISDHGFPGVAGSISVPDLRNRFVIGASPGGGDGSNPAVTPEIGASSSNNTYAVSSHAHTTPGHTHTIDRTQTLHSHSLASGTSIGAILSGSDIASVGGTPIYCVKMADANSGLNGAALTTYVSYAGGTDFSTYAGQGAAVSGLGGGFTLDRRPALTGLLYIIKVKHG